MTASELIEKARDFSPAFTSQAHPNIVCLRALSRAQALLFSKLMELDDRTLARDYIAESGDIEDAIAGSPVAVPAFTKILAVVMGRDEALYHVGVVASESSAGRGGLLARLIGRNLYLGDSEEMQEASETEGYVSPYDGANSLRVTYIPKPVELVAMDDVLAAPDAAEPWLVGCLVEFLAQRAKDRDLIVAGNQMKAAVIDHFLSLSNETAWYVTPT